VKERRGGCYLGFATFAFFLAKGLLWLALPLILAAAR
jgi:hypothetical protein